MCTVLLPIGPSEQPVCGWLGWLDGECTQPAAYWRAGWGPYGPGSVWTQVGRQMHVEATFEATEHALACADQLEVLQAIGVLVWWLRRHGFGMPAVGGSQSHLC